VLRAPLDKLELSATCYMALAFSHDSKLLACSKVGPEIWSVGERKLVAASPTALTAANRPSSDSL